MKLFICWSGTRSKAVAELFNDWLPTVVQSVEPWMSTEIEKGAAWFTKLRKNLDESGAGLICLTPENLQAPWVLFESGAISKSFETPLACTFLLGLRPAQLNRPLSEFQATEANKEDVSRLIRDLNAAAGDRQVEPDVVTRSFERAWPEFEDKLAKIPDAPVGEPHDEPHDQREMIEETLERVRAMEKGLVSIQRPALGLTTPLPILSEAERNAAAQSHLLQHLKQITDSAIVAGVLNPEDAAVRQLRVKIKKKNID